MKWACMRLGKFGRPRPRAELCTKRLHPMTDQNLGHDTSNGSVFCQSCREISRARWYWPRRLEMYWASERWLRRIESYTRNGRALDFTFPRASARPPASPLERSEANIE